MIFTLHFFFGLIAVIIGALPFGLVNLSVVDTTINKSEKDALKLGLGASATEIMFAFIAIFLGNKLIFLIETNHWINFIILAVLIVSAIYFFIKKHKEQKAKHYNIDYFLKGAFLNLISIQVLLYWFLAIAYLETNAQIEFTLVCIIGFLLGVGLGKMLVLLFYRLMSRKIKNKSEIISRNINRIISTVLIIISIVQAIKLF